MRRFQFSSLSSLCLLQPSKACAQDLPPHQERLCHELLGGLGSAFSTSGPPCSHGREGTAQGSCSCTALTMIKVSFSTHPLCRGPPGPAHSPVIPGPAQHLASSAQRCVDCQGGVSQLPADQGLQGRSWNTPKKTEFKRRCGPFHTNSNTYDTPSHPIIALVCTSKMSRVGVASAQGPSKFSMGETEAQKDQKPSKEQRRKKREVGRN